MVIKVWKWKTPKSKNIKTYSEHQFIYECIKGVIPEAYEIDHKKNTKIDNKIENRQVLKKK